MKRKLICFTTITTLLIAFGAYLMSSSAPPTFPCSSDIHKTDSTDATDGLNFIVTYNLPKDVIPTEASTINYIYKFLEQYNFPKTNYGFLHATTNTDELGFIHMKFYQTFCDKIIYGRSISVHFNKDKELYNISGTLENRINSIEKISKNPITKNEAIKLAKAYKKASKLTQNTDVKNYIYYKDNKAYDTYRVTIAYNGPTPVSSYVFVDIYSGKIVDEIDRIKYSE